ncbi:MAG: hypothetical protein J7M11_00830, partial [Elusimicrobia bacterium]|nr:hypothetical protein [Elusimicrobiota bacterium]
LIKHGKIPVHIPQPRRRYGQHLHQNAETFAGLRNMDRYFTVLYQTARIITTCASVEELAEKILPEIIDSLPVSGAAMYMYSIFDEEYDLIAGVSADVPQSVSREASFLKKLGEEESVSAVDNTGAGDLCFFAPVEDDNGLIGFIGLASENEPAAEDRILIETVCKMISPVIVNLRTKQEELMKDRLKNKKWQL